MDSASLRIPGRLLAAFLAVLVFTACGATQSDQAGGSPQDGAEQHEAAPEREQAQGEDAEGAEEGSALGEDVEADERDLVHHARLTVRVEDLDEAAEQAKELTTEAGGYLSHESYESPTGGAARSSLTLRVPTDGYEEALTELAGMGERSSLERSVEDVTEEVADVEGRTESAERSLETLRGYLDEADGVEEMLEVESRIQERQEDLEAFQARLESLENRTAYSTVELTLLPPNAPDDDIEREEMPGFLEGLRSGWLSLLSLGQGVAAAVGWLLPFAAVVAVLGAWPWLRWRARRRARAERGSLAATPAGTGGAPAPGRRAGGPGPTVGPESGEGSEDGSAPR